jgi:glyoxylase-like metal-dependent hydrolase (beta-lactamase superfamily II)
MKLVYGILLGVAAASGLGAEEGIVSYSVGRFEVSLLVESRGSGGAGLLIGADPADIERFMPGGAYPSGVNTFLIRGGGRIVLVDTGFGRALFDRLKALGIGAADVDAILLTHLHGDHIGGLQRDGKALFPKAVVYLAWQERDYWLRPGGPANTAAALAPYGSRVETFLPGEPGQALTEILPGISPVAAFGHTPGHTLYLVRDGGESFLISGDLFHVQAVQFPRPGVSVTYDRDPVAAAASRKRVLEYAAANRIPLGGMHLVSPAVGTVRAEDGGYRFTAFPPSFPPGSGESGGSSPAR